jgi:hypothetical protein
MKHRSPDRPDWSGILAVFAAALLALALVNGLSSIPRDRIPDPIVVLKLRRP